MVVKKSDVISNLTTSQQKQQDRIEKIIDEKLIKEYFCGHTLKINLDKLPHMKVVHNICERYKDAGWNIKFKNMPHRNEKNFWIEIV